MGLLFFYWGYGVKKIFKKNFKNLKISKKIFSKNFKKNFKVYIDSYRVWIETEKVSFLNM